MSIPRLDQLPIFQGFLQKIPKGMLRYLHGDGYDDWGQVDILNDAKKTPTNNSFE